MEPYDTVTLTIRAGLTTKTPHVDQVPFPPASHHASPTLEVRALLKAFIPKANLDRNCSIDLSVSTNLTPVQKACDTIPPSMECWAFPRFLRSLDVLAV